MATNDKDKSIGENSAQTVAQAAPAVNASTEHARKLRAAEARIHTLVQFYREEEKVPVSIAPFYAPYLGNVVRISVNGIVVDVPADGNTYKVNYTHANEIARKMKRINDMRARQNRLSDATKNFESTPGELHL